MLTSTQHAILEALSETGGFETGIVYRTAKFSYGGNVRQRSRAVRSWLLEMKANGLVSLLDNQKPDLWIRTAAGTEALYQVAD